MLEFMRKSANTIFIKLLLGLLILSFAAWGIGDIFSGRAANTSVASVGKTDISVEQYRAEFTRELQRMSEMFGQEISREQAQAMGVGNLLVSRLAQSALINEGAKSLGIYVSDQQILDEIHKTPEFFNEAGRFDRNIFISTLSRSGFNENSYVARVRQNIARQQFLSPIRDGVLAPKGLVDALYSFAAEQRRADVIRIDHASLLNVKTPSAEDLAKFHTENAANFMAPEYRKLTAIVLEASTLADTITLSDAELQAAYDEREGEFLTPEKRVLRQVLVQDEVTATKAKALLDGGKSMTEVAAEVGANPAMVDIGAFTTSDASNLSPDIASAVFALPKGGRSGVLQSPLGWHVFEVVEIQPTVVRALADVRDELTQKAKIERALTALYELSNQVEDKLGGGMTYEEAAASVGLHALHIDALDAQGLGPDGKPVDAPYGPDLAREAFKLTDGQDSQMTEVGDGKAFVVVRLDGVTAPALRPLDTVMKEVSEAWSNQQRSQMAAGLAQVAKDRMTAGESAADVAAAIGFSATTTQPFTREGKGLQNNALPANLIRELFTLSSGGVASAPGTGAHTVARLTDIIQANPNVESAEYKAVADQARGDLQGDLLSQLAFALEGVYDVTINHNAIADAF